MLNCQRWITSFQVSNGHHRKWKKLQVPTAESCSAGVQGIQPNGSAQGADFPQKRQRPTAPALSTLLQHAKLLYVSIQARSPPDATASLQHLVHGCMVCCPSILVGIDDLRPVKDE